MIKLQPLSFVLAALSISTHAAAAPTSAADPGADDVTTLVVTSACFNVKVNVTRLSDLSALPEASIPLCVELPALRASACVDMTGVTDPAVGQYTCDVGPIDATINYVKVSTPGYEFASYVGPIASLTAIGEAVSGGLHGYLELDQAYTLQDVWSYRLSQILSVQRASLPVAFSSLILPALDPSLKLDLDADRFTSTGPVQFNFGAMPTFLGDIQAVGYDAAGVEYGVHISSVFDHAVTAPRR